jgi:hypothetical protein
MKELFYYAWGMIVRPRETIDRLAGLSTLRPAVALVAFTLVLGWSNYLLFTMFQFDWLGTRRELLDPTFIGFFGRLSLDLEDFVPAFHWIFSPVLALLGLAVMPGLAQVLSKLWSGEGRFEQMVNTLVLAQTPSIMVRSLLNDMIIAGVPANLLAGHPYAFTAAMGGEFGPFVSGLWWVYMLGIYILGVDLWVIALGTFAIRRVQRIPWWAAFGVMLLSYLLWFYGVAGTVVR